MGQVLSDKKKRDVYDRFGEEGLKTNNGGGGGGGEGEQDGEEAVQEGEEKEEKEQVMTNPKC